MTTYISGDNFFAPALTASVSISASPSGKQWTGTTIIFTASPTYGGSTPSYQWKVNGSNVGTNNYQYTTTSLANGDVVTCVMTSSWRTNGNPATSNSITASIGTSIVTIDSSTAIWPERAYGLWYPPYGLGPAVGQSFTNLASEMVVTSCVFKLIRYASYSGNVFGRVYAHTGTYGTSSLPTGSPLAQTDSIVINTISDSVFQDITFNFTGANRISLSPSTHYVIVIWADSGDQYHFLTGRVGYNDSHSGNPSDYNLADSIGWEVALPYFGDLYFYVYGF